MDTSENVIDFEIVAELARQIFEDQLRLRTAGIEVRGWTPNRETGVIQMRVISDPVDAQEYVDETYGPGRIDVVLVGPAPATRTQGYY